jgi:signal transduction histidine kinase
MFNGRNFKYNSLVFSSKILLFTGLVAIIVATVISLSIFAYQRRLIIKDHQLEIQFAAENLSKSLSVAMKIKNYPEISRISSQSHLLNRSISLYFTDENDEFLIGITESQILDKIPICSFNKGNINVFFDQIFTGKIYYCYKLNLGNQMPVVTLILVTLALSVFLIILLLFWFRIQTSDIQAVVDYLDMVDPNYPNQVKFRKEITSPIKSVVRKIEVILDKINNQNQEIIKIEKDRLVGVLAKQLSHDIRSPLAALKVVKELGAGGMDPEVGKLLSSSIDRITDIANTILPKKSETTGEDVKNEAEPSFVWMLIDQIISEKRVEYKNIDGVSIQFRVDGSPFKLNAFAIPLN